MKAENNIIALTIAIRDFLEGIKDVHLETFLTDWPPTNCLTRSVLPYYPSVLAKLRLKTMGWRRKWWIA